MISGSNFRIGMTNDRCIRCIRHRSFFSPIIKFDPEGLTFWLMRFRYRVLPIRSPFGGSSGLCSVSGPYLTFRVDSKDSTRHRLYPPCLGEPLSDFPRSLTVLVGVTQVLKRNRHRSHLPSPRPIFPVCLFDRVDFQGHRGS